MLCAFWDAATSYLDSGVLSKSVLVKISLLDEIGGLGMNPRFPVYKYIHISMCIICVWEGLHAVCISISQMN